MQYFWSTLKHKWFFFLACFKTGLPLWLAVTHDLSKFTKAELPHYQRQFFGKKDDPKGFALAWLHHQNSGNDHHWEWWITRSDHSHGGSGAVDGCLEMSDLAILHMITDWFAAGRSYQGNWDIKDWVRGHLPDMKLHPKTRSKVAEQFCKLGLDVQMH